MTSAHILYIPTIFLLGFLTGSLAGKGFANSDNRANGPDISGRVLLGSFVIFAFVFVGTHFFEIPRSSKAVTKALNGLEIFDKKPSYTSDEVYSRIQSFPDSGIVLYKQFTYTIDILFPITLFAFLFLLSRFVVKRTAVGRTSQIVLMAIPVFWLSMDLIENTVIFNLLNNFPVKKCVLAGFLGYITITKFSLLLLSILAPTLMITVHNISTRVSIND